MKTYMVRVLATLLLGSIVPVASLAAATPDSDDTPEVRVVNNHGYRIRVVLVDERGGHHTLGFVAPMHAGAFDIGRRAGAGPVQVKVVVDEPVWSPAPNGHAVRSRTLELSDDRRVLMWVERDLTRSTVEFIGAG